MEKQISVSIPEPCKEKWSSFTPTATGGFCGSCQKNVIDFTHATADEIVAFISRKPEHACGRFRPGQLKTYALPQPATVKPGFNLLKAGIVSLLLLISKPSVAQTNEPRVQQTELSAKTTHEPAKKSEPRTVSGVIRDLYKDLLPAVSVVQKGTENFTVTNEDGRYTITLNPNAPPILIVSFIGMVAEEVNVSNTSKKSFDVIMESDVTGDIGIILLGEAPSDEVYHEPGTLKKLWRKVKNIF